MPKADGLTDKQLRLCQEYLIDLNRSAAYLRAGYKPGKTDTDTSSRASKLYAKPSIQTEVQRLMQERGERTLVTADRVVMELAKVGFGSLRRFIRINGSGQPVIDLTETPEDDLDALAEVQTETVVEREGTGEDALREN